MWPFDLLIHIQVNWEWAAQLRRQERLLRTWNEGRLGEAGEGGRGKGLTGADVRGRGRVKPDASGVFLFLFPRGSQVGQVGSYLGRPRGWGCGVTGGTWNPRLWAGPGIFQGPAAGAGDSLELSWNETQARGLLQELLDLFVGISQLIHTGRNGEAFSGGAAWAF